MFSTNSTESNQIITRNYDGWQLSFLGEDEEPHIQDIELGTKLGYERPRDIRKLIERLVRDEKLNDVHQRATVARYEIRPKIQRGFQVN